MKPPPPRLPALGCVTASAKPVATAASTALPPRARTAAPTSDARPDTDTTTPRRDWTTLVSRRGASWAGDAEAVAIEVASTIATRAGNRRGAVMIDRPMGVVAVRGARRGAGRVRGKTLGPQAVRPGRPSVRQQAKTSRPGVTGDGGHAGALVFGMNAAFFGRRAYDSQYRVRPSAGVLNPSRSLHAPLVPSYFHAGVRALDGAGRDDCTAR